MAKHRTVLISPAAGGENLQSRQELEDRQKFIDEHPEFTAGDNVEGRMKLENLAGGRGQIDLQELRDEPERPLKTED